MLDLTKFLLQIFDPISRLVDDLHTSDEERLAAKMQMMRIQIEAAQQAQQYQQQLLDAQKTIITAEANGQSWLQRSWRPITMLTFLGLVVCDSFGWLVNPLAQEAWTLLQIGLGGYVVGRSGEKIVQVLKQ